ncbi:MAG: TatD family hydrolase [Bacilli bacterium]|nr:TatD family hydrolase [Bacilli bacterium]
MDYLDSHCHLNDEAFKDDVDEVIQKALVAGVKRFLVIGYDVESSKKAVEIASRYDGVYAAVGIHPENIPGTAFYVLDEIEALAKSNKVIAIGEIGLDYYWYKDEEHRQKQKEWFVRQIELANRLGLPASIHARECSGDMYQLLKESPIENKAVLHCYSGSKEMLVEFAKLGYYFGFDGPITFKNAIEPKECVKVCPIDRILTETDCPYMAPVPFRGKRNDPSLIPYIADYAAELKGLSKEEFKKAVWDNFDRLFHMKHEQD